jgi:putative acetyltransferase
MKIRSLRVTDTERVRELLTEAFGRSDEARLLDRLRSSGGGGLSLLAEIEGRVAGLIHFSAVTLPGCDPLSLLALAPLAVEEGLVACRTAGSGAVFVLGDPAYYGRFGFVPTREFGIDSPFGAPAEFYRVLELVPGHLGGASGTVVYPAAFDGL